MNQFWIKVHNCNHKNITNYSSLITCGTDYCSGDEIHCRDCGIYITTCQCGYNEGMSGWSNLRRRRLND